MVRLEDIGTLSPAEIAAIDQVADQIDSIAEVRGLYLYGEKLLEREAPVMLCVLVDERSPEVIRAISDLFDAIAETHGCILKPDIFALDVFVAMLETPPEWLARFEQDAIRLREIARK